MKNQNIHSCKNKFNFKKIFENSAYEWRICHDCDLIYQISNTPKLNNIKETQFNNFEEPQDSAKFEFLSILNKLQKYTNLTPLSFFDFGCGDGSYLKLAEKYFQKVHGMEPNIFLKKRAINKNLNILNDNFFENKDLNFDVIFTRNTFEYVDDFSATLKKLINNLNDGGYFVWRDKFYDYFPKKYSSLEFSGGFNSLPTKNAIKFHLSKNQIEILESRFYFDKSFLIIGKKINSKNMFEKKINLNSIIYNNYFASRIIYYFVEKMHLFYLNIRKLKNLLKNN